MTVARLVVALLLIGVGVEYRGLTQVVDAQRSMGSGVPTFEVDPSWPKLPNNWVIGDPSSIAVDRSDNVWILHRPRTVPAEKKERAAPPVLEFDKNGKFLQAWGGPSDAYEWPDTEHGIYVDYRNNVWIGGNNPNAQLRLTQRSDDMLLKFDSKGKLLMQLGKRDQSQGNKDTKNVHQPADVQVVQKTNEAFVADGYGNRRIVVFDADTGAFKRMWGAFSNPPLDAQPAPAGSPAPARDLEGPGPQQWGIVHAVRIASDGLVYVADRGNSRVQVFDSDGKYQSQVFINRKDKSAATACGLALSSDSQQRFLYVSDFGNGHMWIVERKTLEVVGRFGEQGAEPGNFRNTHHITTDSNGNLYTAEVNPGSRVQKFLFKGMKPRAASAQ
jgi:DNA-binding beta-propeller fold protein YncE